MQTTELSACAEIDSETSFVAGGAIVYRLKLQTFETAEKFRVTETPPLFSRDDGPMFMSPGASGEQEGPATAPITAVGAITISPHVSSGYLSKPCTVSKPQKAHGDPARWKTTFTADMPAAATATVTISHPRAPNANPWPTAAYRSTFDFTATGEGDNQTLLNPVRSVSSGTTVVGASGARVTLRQTSPRTGDSPRSARFVKGRAITVRGRVEAGPEYKSVDLSFWGRKADKSVLVGPIGSPELGDDGSFSIRWTGVPRGLSYAEIRATATSQTGNAEYARCGRTFRTIK